jgi:hypothetical protein
MFARFASGDAAAAASVAVGGSGDASIPVSPGRPGSSGGKPALQRGSSIARISASLSRGMSFKTAFRTNAAGEAGAGDGAAAAAEGAVDLSQRRMTQADVLKVLAALEFAYPPTALAAWFAGREDGLPLEVWKRAVMDPTDA